MTSLKSIYQSFLVKPDIAALNENASLYYITTLTTINTAAAIIKHHAAHEKVLKKKEQKPLSCIESNNGLCLEIETTLEFISGGGAFLPGLDDNFLTDRVVTIPVVHIVHFDSNQKIHQVRLYWDQGSLLKLVDVIGARARGWPIRDGVDQVRLVVSSASGMTQSNGSVQPPDGKVGRDPDEVVITTKPRSQSKHVTGDPHATLSLFGPRDEEEFSQPAVVAPRGSARPPPRDYHELFAGNDSDASHHAKDRSPSPQKSSNGVRALKAQSAKPPPRDYHDLFVGNESDTSPASRKKIAPLQKENMTPGPVASKGGAGKNYQPSRLFDAEGPQLGNGANPQESPSKNYKPHQNKYNHFDFGDDAEAHQPLPTRPKSKHQNNWNFEDFDTPDQISTKYRRQDARQFGWSDDETDSPVKRQVVAQARPNMNANFEFQDDGTQEGGKRPAGHPRGAGNVRTGGALYQNNVLNEQGPPSPEKKQALATISNSKDRSKDLNPHFSLTEKSPASDPKKQHVPEARAKVVQQMGAQWEAKDSSPGLDKKMYLNGDNKKHVGIKSEGDGMGGKKGSGHSWGFGDSGDEQDHVGIKSEGDGMGGKKGTGRSWGLGDSGDEGDHVGIKSGGDGMGGKRGTGRSWGFGDDGDDGAIGGAKAKNFRASKVQQAPRKENDVWDF